MAKRAENKLELETNKCHIISISSDIGYALAVHWAGKGFEVSGTYRTYNENLQKLETLGVTLVYCDLENVNSIEQSIEKLNSLGFWDVLVVAPGAQEPVGSFLTTKFDDWENSINVNFTRQLRIVRGMLPFRNLDKELEPVVLFFAGGGTNNATVNYSAYTISKIASIKICELLDAEILDTRFTIVGPGWVKTKIHEATLSSPDMAGDNYQRTIEMLRSNDCVPMDRVIACCDWLVRSDRSVVSGRNFSLVHDAWGDEKLDEILKANQNLYKLRREGNSIKMDQTDNTQENIQELFNGVWDSISHDLSTHLPSSKIYLQLKKTGQFVCKKLFEENLRGAISIGEFGELQLPYYKMGAIDSIDLFGLDELIIFAFYWRNRLLYKNVCDVGANIGLHSIILGKCGFNVRSYEPDPIHVDKIKSNLSLNAVEKRVSIFESAISDSEGEAEFLRLLGNTTGSHLAGSKDNPYGEIDRFKVKLTPISDLMAWADLIKIDAEGHEPQIIEATSYENWQSTDAIIEIGTEENAIKIFNHINSINVNIYSQKMGWERVTDYDHLPFSHHEGSAFITCKEKMPW